MHPANIASAKAKIGVDGALDLRVRFDILAYCLDLPPAEVGDGPMHALLDGPKPDLETRLADARTRFTQSLQINGKVDSILFPTADQVLALAGADPQKRLPVMMVVSVTGSLAKGAKTSSFRFPDTLGQVILTTEFPYQEPISEPVEPGSASRALALPTQSQVGKAKASMETPRAVTAPPKPVAPAAKKPQANPFAKAKAEAFVLETTTPPPKPQPFEKLPEMAPPITEPSPVVEPQPSQRPPWYAIFPGYVKMGFTHIVPHGLDHILFVLGLFLLSTRMKDLLKQITAFTVAHSLTLALSVYGVVRLPSSLVEPIIALSIAFVAVENLFTTKMHKWRLGVVFVFGLVHGLGFASALQDVGLAKGDFLSALLGFNAGVELGQISVVAAALLLVGWFRSHERYRSMVAVPASFIIAVVAVFWTFQRML